ncbi:H-2 class II histocompatibility antigen, A-U alpha chain-like [Vanacampus margaritifer]
MKVFVFLVLFLHGGDGAASGKYFHTDISVTGCSDTEGEDFYGLDGEDMWVANFTANRGVEPQPNFVDHMSYSKEAFSVAVANVIACKRNLIIARQAMKDQPLEYDPPSHIVYPRDEVALGEKNTLVCHVSGFFPAPVKVHWTKNGKRVAGGGASSAYPDKNGSFHQTFRLDFIPAQDDIYSCVVEHPALQQPLPVIWVVKVAQPGIGPTIFCALGLTVGLMGVAIGTFFLIKGNNCN